MKNRTLFVICMLIIACLGFVAADCNSCKKSDPNYPDCNSSPKPTPAPTVEKWMCLAAKNGWGIRYYSCSDSLILKLWDNGRWYERYLDGYREGIYENLFYILPNGDTSKYIDLYEIFSNGDTTLYRSANVSYADRYEVNPLFTIPAPIVQAIDSLQLNSTVMEFVLFYPFASLQYVYYVKIP